MGIEKIKKLELKKYDVVYVDLGENIGSVQNNKRPCIVLSNNDNSPVCIIAPMTTKKFNKKLRGIFLFPCTYSILYRENYLKVVYYE